MNKNNFVRIMRSIWNVSKNILSSVDFWKIIVPVIIAIVAWSLQENSKLQWEQYKRKEDRYKQLIQSIRGFYSKTLNAQQRQNFIDELNMCWLYAPDEVIIKGYKFLETVHKDKA